MRRHLLLLFIIFIGFASAEAQTTAPDTTQKSIVIKETGHSPKRAVRLSAILPGAGQVYNDKIWKVPIIYAGFATLGYSIHFSHKNFKEFNTPLVNRLNGDSSDVYLDVYTNDNLRQLKNFYQRNRDLSIIGTVVLYTLNIVDAYVDAHLYEFDVSDDLSLRIEPQVTPSFFARNTPVYGLKLKFDLN